MHERSAAIMISREELIAYFSMFYIYASLAIVIGGIYYILLKGRLLNMIYN